MDLGFIGLGAMGVPMVRRLLAAGHAVQVWARRREAADEVVAAGAGFSETPADVARMSEITFTIVTRDADVEAVVLGPQGLAEGMRPGHLHIDMSTVAPGTARRIGNALNARGAALLDAPVSGGPTGAISGTLAIMAGGEAGDLERARPLLDVLGQRIVHVGPQGAGQVAKACNQMVMVAAIEGVAEAMALAAASGLALAKVRQALLGGAAGSRVLEVFGQRMVDGNYANGVESRLHHKDFAIVLAEAHAMNLGLPLAALVWERLNALQARGGARDDTASLRTLYPDARDTAVAGARKGTL
jgi:2-hydroxy-3-oxopropionate reductase